MPVRSSVIKRADCFLADVEALRETYPEIDVAVDTFVETFKATDRLPDIAVGRADFPRVFFRYADYQSLKSDGIKRFIVTYHVQWSPEPMRQPCRTTTLLTIVEAPGKLAT